MLPTINFKIERWKFNKDYGVYVSTLGNFKDKHKRRLPIKINESGYCCIKTEVPSNPWKLAHRIVMCTWKPIPDAENLTVDHLDHNKRNNSVKNLEWVTKKENQTRATADFIIMGMTKKQAKKIAKEAWQKSIVGVQINEDIIDFDVDAIYNIIISKYFPNYPKNKIEIILSHIWNRNNMTGYAKISKSLKLKVIRKEQ